MPVDTTNGETEDWLIECADGSWRVTEFTQPGKRVVGDFSSKKGAKFEVKSRGFPDDVITMFTKSGRDWDTKYVRQMSKRGRGLFDDLG